MIYRKLGRTGLEVSIIGLGTEYLNRKPRDTVVSVVREAIDKGVSYFDVVFAFPEYRDNMAAAFRVTSVLSTKASKCTECGICMKRCPFDVNVIEKMKQAMLKI